MRSHTGRRGRLALLLACSAASLNFWSVEGLATDSFNVNEPQSLLIASALDDLSVKPAESIGAVVASDSAVESDIELVVAMDCQVCGPMLASPAPACACQTCCSKEQKENATAAMKSAYAGVFYGNNFKYLSDPCYDGKPMLGDSLKGLCDGKLDIGGESRYRYHSETNMRGLGLTGNDDDFWLVRQRLFANWRVTDDIRVFAEYIYADSGGEEFRPRPIEENHSDAQNLFVDAKLFDGDMGSLVLRGGRQELLYGNQRLISPLDWANTRRTFDGARGLYKKGDVQIDSFWTQPVIVDRNDFDNGDENQDFYGVYAAHAGLIGDVTDLYYVGYNNENNANNPNANVGNFHFHTIGSRVAGATKGGTLYEFEGGFQFGQNNNGSSHDAAFFVGGLGRKLDLNVWTPTVWGWYDYASGEDDFARVAEGDDGFHHLLPLAHKYNGFMDLFGRRNLHDINAQIITPINAKVSFLVWYHYFLLDELTTPYSVVMTPFSTQTGAGQAGDRELGHEIDLLFNINLDARHNVQLGYSHFTAGDYYDTTVGVPTNADADFFYAQFQTQY